MNAVILLLALSLVPADAEVLVLWSGHQIAVSGPLSVQDGKIVFRDRSGVLYSLPIGEVDVTATEKVNAAELQPFAKPREEVKPAEPPMKIRVSKAEKERLLRELEKSRGKPAPRQTASARPLVVDETVEVRDRSEESWWRAESKRFEENVRRRQEEIELLKERIQRTEDQVRTLLSIGVPPDQYGYQIIQLADSRTMLEQARLDLTRAERELSDFRERARREGILPGWLR